MGGPQRDEAFEAAFRDLHPRAQRLALRIVGERAVADEIASEALARTFADWKRLRSVDYLDAWVLRVTTNLALHVAMRRKVQLLPPPRSNPRTASPSAWASSLRCAAYRPVSVKLSPCATSQT